METAEDVAETRALGVGMDVCVCVRCMMHISRECPIVAADVLYLVVVYAAAPVTEEDLSSSSSSPRADSSPPPSEQEQELEHDQESVDVNGRDPLLKQQQPQQQEVNGGDTTAAGANSSNTNDLVMQLRVWKERSSRMEVLLAKKSAKLQEMEETVALF